MGKALNGEAAGLEGLWTVETAFGARVRTKIDSPAQHRLLASAGALEDGPPAPVVLDAEQAQALKDLQVGPGPNAALGLAGQIIGQVNAHTTTALNADANTDAQAIADKVIPKLQAAVDSAVDAQLDAAGRALAD